MKKLNYSFGIAAKMILVVSLIIVGAIGAVVYIATDLFKEESITRAQENNRESAKHLSDRVYSSFQSATQSMRTMAQFASNSGDVEEAKRAIDNALKASEDLVSFYAYFINEKGLPQLVIQSYSETALAEFSVSKEQILKIPENKILSGQRERPEDFLVFNSGSILNRPFYSLSFMSRRDPRMALPKKAHPLFGRWVFRAELRHSTLLKLFPENSFISSYVVSANGKLLAHSQKKMQAYMMQDTNMIGIPIVDKLLEGKVSNHQMEYQDLAEETYLGAYHKLGIAGIGVVSEISKTQALATIDRVRTRSFWVMVIVVCLAFFVNYAFSSSLTQPIKDLFSATEQIVDGNFDVQLESSSSDEIGALSLAFRDMASGLKERDKIKLAFGKFHSKEVAKKLLSGEIKLGGERKNATVFFSDIRGFTAMSEKMTPDQVVALLNEYMSSMVEIIFKWQGVVDKYIGDAIMAVWGVPELHAEDSYRALRCCLEMREFLIGFNKDRESRGEISLSIGIGLHSGEVLAGNIGSEQRLEYTVIGDTVNQASRIEAANKAVGADILISAETYALVRDRGIVVGPPVSIVAKGKKDELVVHQVIGYKEESGHLVSSLSKEKISDIESKIEIEQVNEEKVGLAVSASENHSRVVSSEHASSRMPPPGNSHYENVSPFPELNRPLASAPKISQEIPEWFVARNGDPSPIGPLTISEIALKVAHGQLNPDYWFAYRTGDQKMTQVKDLPGLNRRAEAPPIAVSVPGAPSFPGQPGGLAEAWYIYGPSGQNLGPYSEAQLAHMMASGSVSRTTYVWKPSLANWIYLYQIPGFDRRTA